MNRSFSILICSLLLLTSTVTGVAQNKNTDRYYKKLQIAEKEGKYGILFRGEVVVPYEYDMITAQKDKQGFVSKQDGKSGIIRLLIYDADNTSVYHFSTWQKSYSFAKNPDDKKGKNIMVTVSEIPCEFDEIKEMNGRYLVSKGGRKGICYYHGKEILPCEFDKIELTPDNKYVAYKNGEKRVYTFAGSLLHTNFDRSEHPQSK